MNFKTLIKAAIASVMLVATTASADVQRIPAAVKGRHLIVTMHGVRGTEKSFGLEFHQIIKKHLEAVDPGYVVHTINFTYKTGQDDYHPANMKDAINQAILKELGGNVADSDKISILGYSMGGQVMAHWYFNTIFDQQNARIAEKTVNLIGLGAAFWGSLNATLGKDLIPQLGVNVDNFAKKLQMSGNEMRNLSTISSAVEDLREKMVEWRTNPALRNRFKPKIFSIAGLIPCIDQLVPGAGCGQFSHDITKVLNDKIMLNQLFSGLTRWETDMMVIVPSARLDFVYYKDQKPGLSNVAAAQFTNMEAEEEANTRFLPVDALHASDLALIEGKEKAMYDVVILPKKCIDPKQCDQRTYKYMFEALAGCKQKGSTCNMQAYQQHEDDLFAASSGGKKLNREQTWAQDWKVSEQLQGFFVEIRLRLPKGYQLPDDGEIDESNIFKFVKFDFDDNIFLKSYDFMEKTIVKVGSVEKEISELGYAKQLRERLAWNGTASTSVSDIAKVQIGRSFQFESRQVEIIKNTEGNPIEVRLGLSGRFIPGKDINLSNEHHRRIFFETIWKNKVVAPFIVDLPGLAPREIHPVIRPTAATYIDLTLSEKQ